MPTVSGMVRNAYISLIYRYYQAWQKISFWTLLPPHLESVQGQQAPSHHEHCSERTTFYELIKLLSAFVQKSSPKRTVECL